MANGAKLAAVGLVRLMNTGYPGTAKSGQLASLVNAGFKLRILDYDGNLAPLWQYSNPKNWGNVDALHFADKLKVSPNFTMVEGQPTAFANGLNAMDHWRYYRDNDQFILPGSTPDPKREVVDLGHSKDWGPDTIVVLDTLTRMGEAAFARAMKMLNKTPLNMTIQAQGLAQAEQLAFIKKLVSHENKFHVIVNAHIKTISPKDVEKSDDQLTKDLKERIADIVPTKLFPRALGRELPQQIGGEFSTLIKSESKVLPGNKVKRVIRTVPEAYMDIKLPANLPAELDVSTGLLQIFQALSPASVAMVKGNGAPSIAPVATEEEPSNG